MGLIGTALGAVGSIFGGIKASQAMKKVQQNLEQQQRENTDWYNRRFNEDATQRADAQRILTMTENAIKNRNKAAAATQAVMGGTEESVAAEKAANAGIMADAAAQIAVNADRRKDNIEQQYQANREQISNKINDMEVQKANAIGKAAMGVANAAGKMDFGSASILGKQIKL